MYSTGSERRSERAKTNTAKREREARPDVLYPQIQALGAMDEVLDEENTTQASKKGQEDWQMNLATMKSQCPICNKKKGKPFNNTRHYHFTLFGMPTHVEASRYPTQRHRPQSHLFTGPNQAPGHTV